VDGFLEGLKRFHEGFRYCFSPIEPRGSFFRNMVGQLSKTERKSIELIAFSVEQASVPLMQRTLSGVLLDEAKVIKEYRSMVNEDTGDPNGMLLFDGSGFSHEAR
jgi:hypothetical protein